MQCTLVIAVNGLTDSAVKQPTVIYFLKILHP